MFMNMFHMSMEHCYGPYEQTSKWTTKKHVAF